MSVTYLLDEILEEQKNKRENLRKQTIDNVFQALAALSKKITYKSAYIFGSLTKPYRFSNNSDIDIGFCGLKDKDFFKASAFLSSKLGKDVDVIQLEGYRLKEKVIKEGLNWKKQN